jgi:hypothetical protein
VYGDLTNSTEIKNDIFVYHPYYNKNNIRDFLLPITMYFRSLYYKLGNIGANTPNILTNLVSGSSDNVNKHLINIINNISDIIIKTNPSQYNPVQIYLNEPSPIIKTPFILQQADDQYIQSLFSLPYFNGISDKSKKLIYFIESLNKISWKLITGYNEVSNVELHDDTFSNPDDFNNLHNIIKKIYLKLPSIYTNITCDNNECLFDNIVTKYYLTAKIFDNGGILNKTKLKEYINNKYKKFKNNLENNKNIEIATKDAEIATKKAEIATKDAECDTKIKDILKKEYKLMNDYKQQLDNEAIKYKQELNNEAIKYKHQLDQYYKSKQ